MITSLLGTQMGVPGVRKPASITTPAIIGSRELNTNCGSILILQGKTFILLCSRLPFSNSSSCKTSRKIGVSGTKLLGDTKPGESESATETGVTRVVVTQCDQ